MSKNVLYGAILPTIFLAVAGSIFYFLESPEPPRVEPLGENIPALLNVLPIAQTAAVRDLSELSETLNIPVSGVVVPYRELQLAAEVQGRIIEKAPRARSGNYVTKGQLLYRIDPRDYQLTIERLEGSRAAALASLTELNQEISNSESLLAVVDQQVALAAADVKRFETISHGFASAAELDSARQSQLSSMNQRVTVRNQLLSNRSRLSRMDLAIKTADTELEQAKLDLERSVVRSPVDGRIVSEQVEVDSYVQRGSQMILIEDTHKVEVACSVRMDQLYWILDQQALSAEQISNPAQATRYELPQTPVRIQFKTSGRSDSVYEWSGRLDRYDGAGLDAQSRMVPIRVLVDDPSSFRKVGANPDSGSPIGGPPMLVRGMFVEVIVEAKPATQLMLVPKLSIKPATTSYKIWKFVEDDSAVFESKQSIRERALAEEEKEADGEDPTKPVKKAPDANRDEKDGGDNAKAVPLPDPTQWQAGFLQVVGNVRVVGAYVSPDGESMIDGIEYSICEVAADLAARDMVVVTPLPGIVGNGRDPIRVRKPATDEKPQPADTASTDSP